MRIFIPAVVAIAAFLIGHAPAQAFCIYNYSQVELETSQSLGGRGGADMQGDFYAKLKQNGGYACCNWSNTSCNARGGVPSGRNAMVGFAVSHPFYTYDARGRSMSTAGRRLVCAPYIEAGGWVEIYGKEGEITCIGYTADGVDESTRKVHERITRMPGQARALNVSGGGWVVGTNSQVYVWMGSSGWRPVAPLSGGATRIAVGTTGIHTVVWAIDSKGGIHRSDNLLTGRPGWVAMRGRAVDIAVGGGRLWALGTKRSGNDHVAMRWVEPAPSQAQPTLPGAISGWSGGVSGQSTGGQDTGAGRWVDEPRLAGSRIAVDRKGNPWVTTADGRVRWLDGSTVRTVSGLTARQISVVDGTTGPATGRTAWAVGTEKTEGDNFGLYKWDGRSWNRVSGNGGVEVANHGNTSTVWVRRADGTMQMLRW